MTSISVFTITNSDNLYTLFTTLGNLSTSASSGGSSTSTTPHNYQSTTSPVRRPLQPPTEIPKILTYPFPTSTRFPPPSLLSAHTSRAKKNALTIGFAVAAVAVIIALIILRFCKRGKQAGKKHTPVDCPAEEGRGDFEYARQEIERREKEDKMRIAREEVEQVVFDNFDGAHVLQGIPLNEEEGGPRLRRRDGLAFEWDLTGP